MRVPSILAGDSEVDSPVTAIGDHVWQEEPCQPCPDNAQVGDVPGPCRIFIPSSAPEIEIMR
jgi:hypothetical protein